MVEHDLGAGADCPVGEQIQGPARLAHTGVWRARVIDVPADMIARVEIRLRAKAIAIVLGGPAPPEHDAPVQDGTAKPQDGVSLRDVARREQTDADAAWPSVDRRSHGHSTSF